jgi:NAD(P)-dependent dehydrogenase (short-subunit alcohol dehydrogenase family)
MPTVRPTYHAPMDLAEKVAVVTGAASGIGAAMAQRFAREGARAVVLADIDEPGLQRVAESVTATGTTAVVRRCDVRNEADVAEVAAAAREVGPIDLFCSNAGIGIPGGPEVPDQQWQAIWEINVMAHVHAARAVLPDMIERGEGYLLNTASAAGLLSQIGSAPYAVTKHAAVAFAEWLAITYGDRGIVVSVLCPQAVRTAMTAESEGGGVAGVDGMMEPDEVADSVIEGLASEQFLILPHSEVREYLRRKADDHDRWIAGMRRLQARYGDLA